MNDQCYSVSNFKFNLILHLLIFTLISFTIYALFNYSNSLLLILSITILIYAIILYSIYCSYLKNYNAHKNFNNCTNKDESFDMITTPMIYSLYNSYLDIATIVIIPLILAVLIIYLFI